MKHKEELNKILKQNDYNIEDIVNIYLVGSYLFETNNENSDFDFSLIIKGDYFDGRRTLDDGLYNLNLYHVDYFKLLIKEQCVDALMCLWIPEKFKIFETKNFDSLFRLNVKKLHQQFIHEASLNWNKAKGNFSKNKKFSLKYVAHCFRKLMFAVQIWKNKKMIDYTAGNDYYKELFNQEYESWKEIESKFYQDFSDLVHSMKDYIFEDVKNPSLKMLNKIIEEKGLPYLTEMYSLDYIGMDSLVYFILDEYQSEEISQMNAFCQGKVLKNGDFIFNFPSYSKPDTLKKFNFKDASFFENLDGVLVGMFYSESKWSIIYSNQTSFREYYSENIRNLNCNYIRVSKFDFPIEESFWKIWDDNKYEFPGNKNLEITFVLNLKNENNIVLQKQNQLIVKNIYDRKLKKNLNIFDSNYNWKTPKRYNFDNQKLVMEKIDSINPLLQKGLICVDDKNMIELISTQFVNLEILKNNLLIDPLKIRKSIIDILRMDCDLEFLKLLPWNDLTESFEGCKLELLEFERVLMNIYQDLKDLPFIEYAKECQKFPFVFPLMQIQRNGDFKLFLKQCPIQKLITTMKIVKEHQTIENKN
jgi:predicted nucleotidyltransferase